MNPSSFLLTATFSCLSQGSGGGYDDFSYQANPQGYPLGSQVDPGNPLNDIIYGPASGFIQTGLGAYGQRVFGSGQEFVRSNVSDFILIPLDSDSIGG